MGKDKEGIGRITEIKSNCCNVTKKCYHLTVFFFPDDPSVACVNFHLPFVCMAEVLILLKASGQLSK